MEWSEEITLLFIDEYKKRPVLWDLADPFHYHKIKRNDAWSELADIVGKSPKELKKKWDNLLASFRRERAKLMKVETRKDAEGAYGGTWYAFEAMRFTMEKNKPRQSLNTIQAERSEVPLGVQEGSDTEEQLADDGIPEGDKDNSEPPSQITFTPLLEEPSQPTQRRMIGEKKTSSKRAIGAKQRKIEEERRLDKAFEILQSTSTPKLEDDADIFGKLVASKLKRYDNYTKSVIENKIMSVFLDAERGFF